MADALDTTSLSGVGECVAGDSEGFCLRCCENAILRGGKLFDD